MLYDEITEKQCLNAQYAVQRVLCNMAVYGERFERDTSYCNTLPKKLREEFEKDYEEGLRTAIAIIKAYKELGFTGSNKSNSALEGEKNGT